MCAAVIFNSTFGSVALICVSGAIIAWWTETKAGRGSVECGRCNNTIGSHIAATALCGGSSRATGIGRQQQQQQQQEHSPSMTLAKALAPLLGGDGSDASPAQRAHGRAVRQQREMPAPRGLGRTLAMTFSLDITPPEQSAAAPTADVSSAVAPTASAGEAAAGSADRLSVFLDGVAQSVTSQPVTPQHSPRSPIGPQLRSTQAGELRRHSERADLGMPSLREQEAREAAQAASATAEAEAKEDAAAAHASPVPAWLQHDDDMPSSDSDSDNSDGDDNSEDNDSEESGDGLLDWDEVPDDSEEEFFSEEEEEPIHRQTAPYTRWSSRDTAIRSQSRRLTSLARTESLWPVAVTMVRLWFLCENGC